MRTAQADASFERGSRVERTNCNVCEYASMETYANVCCTGLFVYSIYVLKQR
jgi:hypothetical protein